MAWVTVPATYTGGNDRTAWIRSRHAAAVEALQRRGLSYTQAWWAAVALLGHWIRETGWGRSEHQFSVGNIRATSAWNGRVQYLQGGDDAAPAPYRAYGSVAEGVENAVKLAVDSSLYRHAFQQLLASESGGPYVVNYGTKSVAFPIDAPAWYSALAHAGWHPWTAEGMAEYRGTVIAAAQAVGAPPYVSSTFGKVAVGAGVAAVGMALFVVLRGRR